MTVVPPSPTVPVPAVPVPAPTASASAAAQAPAAATAATASAVSDPSAVPATAPAASAATASAVSDPSASPATATAATDPAVATPGASDGSASNGRTSGQPPLVPTAPAPASAAPAPTPVIIGVVTPPTASGPASGDAPSPSPSASAASPAAEVATATLGAPAPVAVPAQTPSAPTVPVATAPAPATLVPVRMAETVQRLQDLVHVATARGVARARLQLHPAELGAIDVRLRSSAEGLVARIAVQQPEALQAVVQAGQQLRQALEDRGLVLARLDVDLADPSSAAGQGASGFERRDAQGTPGGASARSRGVDAVDADDDATDLVPDPATPLPAGALVDVQA